MGRLLLMVFVAGMVWAQGPMKFMGRVVTVTAASYDTDDPEHFYPKGPAKICLGGSPPQCYSTEDGYGGEPAVKQIRIDKSTDALFLSAVSGGVSQRVIRFALLRPGLRNELENLFPLNLEVSDQGRHKWWADSSISDAKIFVTAEYEWGPGESHFEDHRYIISSYVARHDSMRNGIYYSLYDRYMTIRKYNPEKAKILDSERSEIIARLKRVKQ